MSPVRINDIPSSGSEPPDEESYSCTITKRNARLSLIITAIVVVIVVVVSVSVSLTLDKQQPEGEASASSTGDQPTLDLDPREQSIVDALEANVLQRNLKFAELSQGNC